MARFDFIDVSMRGYQSVWENRAVIMQLAALPFFVKMGSFAAVLFLGLEMNFLRQGLVLLPSYFAEGLVVVYTLRMLIGGGEIGGGVKDAQRLFAQDGGRDLMAGMVIYVLVKLVMACASGMVLNDALVEVASRDEVAAPEPSGAMFIVMMVGLAFLIWAVRLLWIYVPVAMGIPALRFLKRIPGYGASFRMMGVGFLCSLPFGILMMFVYQVLAGALGHSADTPSEVLPLLLIPVQSAIELVIALVSSVAMAYAVQQIFSDAD